VREDEPKRPRGPTRDSRAVRSWASTSCSERSIRSCPAHWQRHRGV